MRHDPAGASIIIMLRSLKLRHAKGVHHSKRTFGAAWRMPPLVTSLRDTLPGNGR